MGYTHRWSGSAEIPAPHFQAIRGDFERLILPLSDMGVHLAGPDGDGVPILDRDRIAFNGVRECGHPANEEIAIPYPSEFAQGLGSSEDSIDGSFYGLGVTLKHRCCGGACGCEAFDFPRVITIDRWRSADERGFFLEAVKTAFRPYDIAVTAALLIAKRHLQDAIIVESCGAESQWGDAKRLCQQVLGYGDWFGIVEENVEEEWPGPNGEAEKRALRLRTLIGTAAPLAV